MKAVFCVLTVILVSILGVYGQKKSAYYVLSDSVYIGGAKIINRGQKTNARYATIETDEGISWYTPHEVNEYGYAGTVYRAKDIVLKDSTERVFLEMLTHGKLTLYYYRQRGKNLYFLEDSLGLYPFNRRGGKEVCSYRQLLAQMTGHSVQGLPYSRRPISEYVRRFNKNDLRPIPFARVGLSLGMAGTTLSASTLHNSYIPLQGFVFKPNYWLAAAMFIERSNRYGNFSTLIRPEFTQVAGSYNKSMGLDEVDILHKSSTVNVPLLMRYIHRGGVLRPYVDAGAGMWYDLSNYSEIHMQKKTGNQVLLESPVVLPLTRNIGVSYVCGAGLDIAITRAYSLFFEIRVNRLEVFKNTEDALHFNKTGYQIYAGISF